MSAASIPTPSFPTDPNIVDRTRRVNVTSPDAIRQFEKDHEKTGNPIAAPNILQQASAIIYGDREKTYGSPDKNLKVIAGLWSAYLGHPITIDDVCILMILLKAARLKTTPEHKDSQIDLCGYAALMERVQDFKKENDMKK